MKQLINAKERAALYRVESGMDLLEGDLLEVAGALRKLEYELTRADALAEAAEPIADAAKIEGESCLILNGLLAKRLRDALAAYREE